MFSLPEDQTFAPVINRNSKHMASSLDPLHERQEFEQRRRRDRIAQLTSAVESERRREETFVPKISEPPCGMNMDSRVPLAERTNQPRQAVMSYERAPAAPQINAASDALAARGAQQHADENHRRRKQVQDLWAQFSDDCHSMRKTGAVECMKSLGVHAQGTVTRFLMALGFEDSPDIPRSEHVLSVDYDRFSKVLTAVLKAAAGVIAAHQNGGGGNEERTSQRQQSSSPEAVKPHMQPRSNNGATAAQQQRSSSSGTTATTASSTPASKNAQYFSRRVVVDAIPEEHQRSASVRAPSFSSAPAARCADDDDIAPTTRQKRTTDKQKEVAADDQRRQVHIQKRRTAAVHVDVTTPRAVAAAASSEIEKTSLMREEQEEGQRPSTAKVVRRSPSSPSTSRAKSESVAEPSSSMTTTLKNGSRARTAAAHTNKDDLTFRPKINTNIVPANRGSVLRPAMTEETRQHLETLRIEQEQRRLDECTFQPTILPSGPPGGSRESATLHHHRPQPKIIATVQQQQQQQQQQRHAPRVFARLSTSPSRMSDHCDDNNDDRYLTEERSPELRWPTTSNGEAHEEDSIVEDMYIVARSSLKHNGNKTTTAASASASRRRSSSSSEPKPRECRTMTIGDDDEETDEGEGSISGHRRRRGHSSSRSERGALGTSSHIAASMLGATPGFEKAVRRMSEGRSRSRQPFEESLRGGNTTVYVPSVPLPPPTGQPHAPVHPTEVSPFHLRTDERSIERETAKPLLYVDVDLPHGRVGRIGVHRGDTAAALARSFCVSYGLDEETMYRLTDVLQVKIDSVVQERTRTLWL